MFSAQTVKELREMTGCGMMDCKNALTETGGDIDKAVEYLREKGMASAAKKAGRIAAEGMVASVVCGDVGVVVEVNSETDFVAKNQDFQDFVNNLAAHIGKNNPADVETLAAQPFDADSSKTVSEALTSLIAIIGENMNIRRFARYDGVCEAYVHGGGRIGVLVQFNVADAAVAAKDEFRTYAKDVAMQIAAANPLYATSDEVPSDVIEKEKEILRAQALNEGKPEAIVDKMVVGRVQKYYKEICLVEQPYIKDSDISVKQYTENTAKALGTDISIVKFARFEKGEGIEKKEDDFAAEVAKMSGN